MSILWRLRTIERVMTAVRKPNLGLGAVRLVLGLAGAAVLLGFGPSSASAQSDLLMVYIGNGGRDLSKYRSLIARSNRSFTFSRENGWTRRALAVAGQRRAARQMMLRSAAALSGSGATTLAGDLRMPVFLVLYSNTDSADVAAKVPRATMQTRMYGVQAAPPYSVRTYYEEISGNRLHVDGTVFPWTRMSRSETFYEGPAGCQGICGQDNVDSLIAEAVLAHDDTVDFGLYDNDGPDNIPNSGDDDGFVDAVVVFHPEVDGSCRAVEASAVNNIWAQKSTIDTTTNDVSASGGMVRIRDYIIQGGQGGNSGCAPDQPQAIGLVAHETGHLLALPDLYDTFFTTAGIGHWGLMGSGNFKDPHRPAHMTAWSRADLGWVTEVLVPADTVLTISPIEVSDTAYLVPVAGSSEYFLLENRQRIGSDSQMWGPGLLVWHVDSALMSVRRTSNFVNRFDPHGIALEQADGRLDLRLNAFSRGDAGDPFPGSTGNTRFSYSTNPSSARNNGVPTYITVDSIQQLAPDGPIRVVIEFSHPTVIAASDTLAEFRFDAMTTRAFSGVLQTGSSHTLDIDSVQTANGGLNRYTWLSWSNGQPRSHTFLGSSKGDTITAALAAEFWMQVTTVGAGGTVTATPSVDLDGEFLAGDSVVTLVATITDSAWLFDGWSGSVMSTSDTLVVTMTAPHVLTATFALPLVADASAPPGAVIGATYQHQLVATGGVGSYQWRRVGGSLPAGMVLGNPGLLVGTPTDTGSFTFDAEVVSGSQADTVQLQLDVQVPFLALADVLDHLVGVASKLSAGDENFLDLIGNQNGGFDVGDFAAWVEQGGISMTAAQAKQLTTLLGRTP